MIFPRMVNIALIISILIFGAGCTTSSDGMIFQSSMASSTDIPTTIVDTEVSNCELTIMGIDGVKIFITDPLNKHIGVPLKSEEIVNEIPGADYDIDPSWGTEGARGDAVSDIASLLILSISDPKDGLYLVQIHGTPTIPGGGLSVVARCGEESETTRMVILEESQKLPIMYQFTFSAQEKEAISELARRK